MKDFKRKRIITIIVTALIMTCLFSVGVVAWFTVSNQANVNKLAISAGTVGTLKIADSNASGTRTGEYTNAIALNVSDVVLSPVTTTNGVLFKSPVYRGDTVVDLNAITNDKLNQYIYEKKYYLKVEADDTTVEGNYKIYLTSSNNKTGTYLENIIANSANDAVNAIRISFTATDKSGTKTYIYEPGYGGVNAEQETAEDKNKDTIPTADLIQNKASGQFQGANAPDSAYIFEVEPNQELLVTMRVWIEGKDPECANSIQLNDITGSIQFASVNVNYLK
jgi:hypothetical protein